MRSAADHLQARLKGAVKSKLRSSWRGQQAVHIYQLLDQDEPTQEMVQYVEWLLHWTHASASQFKALDRCERYWWYNKVAKLQTESTPALAKGSEVHRQLEHYLNYNRMPTDPTAKLFLPHIPHPTPGIPNGPDRPYQVEHSMQLVLPGAKVPIIGAIDLRTPGHVIDFKTTKNLNYALTPDRLKFDRQAKIYCLAERSMTPGLPYYTATWKYGTTGSTLEYEEHTYQFSNEELDAVVPELVTALNRMHELTQKGRGTDVPANGVDLGNCFMYNRPCDFKEICMSDGNRNAPTFEGSW
jgi:hypothetical protein